LHLTLFVALKYNTMKGKKYGGRTRGTPNAITSDLRHFLSEMIHSNLENDLMQCSAPKRAELLVRCLPYILPTYPDADISQDIEPLTLVLTRESCSKCEH
jgi:hypothetical protein